MDTVFTDFIVLRIWKTAAMLDYKEMVASMGISVNVKRHFRMLLVYVLNQVKYHHSVSLPERPVCDTATYCHV